MQTASQNCNASSKDYEAWMQAENIGAHAKE
jgi:hypothetical protein